MSSKKILERYGRYVAAALAAFKTDVDYLCEMARAGNRVAAGIEAKERSAEARAAARAEKANGKR